ncbi:hypothetical protein BDY24DRAFT_442444 [Mrakia frigida]|uniref:Zn(II)2Cys6 transcription factor domain-containing protein n=1 Tax=Mrakia frigida TaxID=29902 RepID=UPI003FCBF1F8
MFTDLNSEEPHELGIGSSFDVDDKDSPPNVGITEADSNRRLSINAFTHDSPSFSRSSSSSSALEPSSSSSSPPNLPSTEQEPEQVQDLYFSWFFSSSKSSRLNNPRVSQSDSNFNTTHSPNPSPFSLPSQREPTPCLSSETHPTAQHPSSGTGSPQTQTNHIYDPFTRPTPAHFAAPNSRTVFADALDLKQWKHLVRVASTEVRRPSIWKKGDAFEVKMRKGWEWQKKQRRLEGSPPTASYTSSSTIPYTFSSDPYLHTPTSAHFADPSSRTIFVNHPERSAWLSLRGEVQKGVRSDMWLPTDEDSVKMRKGWEVHEVRRKRREDKRIAVGKVKAAVEMDLFIASMRRSSATSETPRPIPPPPPPAPSLHRPSSPNGSLLVPPSSSFDLPQLALRTTTACSSLLVYPDLTPTDQAALVLHHLSRIPPSSPPNNHHQLSDEYLHEDGGGGPSGSYGGEDEDDEEEEEEEEEGLVELSLQQQPQDALDEQDALLDEHDQQEEERYDDLAYGEPGGSGTRGSRPRAGAGTGRGGASKKAKKVKLDLGDAGRKEGKRAQVKNACTNCQRKGTGELPCSNCLKSGVLQPCEIKERAPRTKGLKRGPTNPTPSSPSSDNTLPLDEHSQSHRHHSDDIHLYLGTTSPNAIASFSSSHQTQHLPLHLQPDDPSQLDQLTASSSSSSASPTHIPTTTTLPPPPSTPHPTPLLRPRTQLRNDDPAAAPVQEEEGTDPSLER